MRQTNILVYSKNADILQVVLRLINREEAWSAEGFTTEEELIERFVGGKYQLLLLGSGISEASESKVRKLFTYYQPDVPIVQHYGGGSGLLKAEIERALTAKPQLSVQVNDNPFS